MTTDAQILTPDQIRTPAIDAIVGRRPRALGHFEVGKYGNIVDGWRAQYRLNRARLADEMASSRLPLCSGDALLELARSEFWLEVDSAAQTAIGEVELQRTVTNTNSTESGNFTSGVIPSGTRFRLAANPSASPAVAEATFTSTQSVVAGPDSGLPASVGGGKFLHTQIVFVPVQCTSSGSSANVPLFIGESGTLFQVVDQLFDPTFAVTLSASAGGSDGIADATIRQASTANYFGQFGATNAALIAGALETLGTQHVALSFDPTTAQTVVYMTDSSWGVSSGYLKLANQSLQDNWCGFGCSILAGPVFNQRVTLQATVMLADPRFASDPSPIVQSVQTGLASYFNDRPDWYTWRLSAIGALIARSSDSVLACSSVAVLDGAGNVLAEPPASIPALNPFATHYFLDGNAVNLTFVNPS